jgi:hypothetical protein
VGVFDVLFERLNRAVGQAGMPQGDRGMAPKGSTVIQAMLRRLAQEELESLAVQCKKEKATGSVEAAKPLQAKAAVY